jgi:hypothetical protein
MAYGVLCPNTLLAAAAYRASIKPFLKGIVPRLYVSKKNKKNVVLPASISKMIIFAAQIETNYRNN